MAIIACLEKTPQIPFSESFDKFDRAMMIIACFTGSTNKHFNECPTWLLLSLLKYKSNSTLKIVELSIVVFRSMCYKLVQGFRVACLFTDQYNTKVYDMITDVI